MTTSSSVQTSIPLVGRALLALLFIPAGWAKIAGFSGVAGYIASKGVPLPEVAAAIDHQFANAPAETRSASEAAAIGSILGRYRIFMTLAEFLGLVAVVAIGLVAANTAAMSIRERRSEIAVMRSIGFPSGVILRLLVGESLIVAVSGGAIGCGVAFGLFKAFALNADALGPFVSLHVPPVVLAETLGVAALLGVLSAYVPARAAAKRSIVETLRLVD